MCLSYYCKILLIFSGSFESMDLSLTNDFQHVLCYSDKAFCMYDSAQLKSILNLLLASSQHVWNPADEAGRKFWISTSRWNPKGTLALCIESCLQWYGRYWNKKHSITIFKVFFLKRSCFYKILFSFSTNTIQNTLLAIFFLKILYYQKKTTLVQL